jgi:cobalamin biosynthesis protein CobD/CbiB
MKPVEIVARIIAWTLEKPSRTHVAHGVLAGGISLVVTLAVHTLVFRWLTLFGSLSGWAGWLLAGSYGFLAGAGFYALRETEQGIRAWTAGRVPGLDHYYRQHDPKWDVFAALIGAAVPPPLLAFGPDLLAALL